MGQVDPHAGSGHTLWPGISATAAAIIGDEGLRPQLRRVELQPGQSVYDAYQPQPSVYLLLSGLAAIGVRADSEHWVDIGIVGRGEICGLAAGAGLAPPPHRCVVRVGGDALACSAAAFTDALKRNPVLDEAVWRLWCELAGQAARAAHCNALHPLSGRLASCLLLVQDRLDGTRHIPLTHDGLAALLGVCRAGVTTALRNLEQAGTIRQQWGRISVENRPDLVARACCYPADSAPPAESASASRAATPRG